MELKTERGRSEGRTDERQKKKQRVKQKQKVREAYRRTERRKKKRGLGSVHSWQLLSLLLGYRPQTNGLKVSQEQK